AIASVPSAVVNATDMPSRYDLVTNAAGWESVLHKAAFKIIDCSSIEKRLHARIDAGFDFVASLATRTHTRVDIGSNIDDHSVVMDGDNGRCHIETSGLRKNLDEFFGSQAFSRNLGNELTVKNVLATFFPAVRNCVRVSEGAAAEKDQRNDQ